MHNSVPIHVTDKIRIPYHHGNQHGTSLLIPFICCFLWCKHASRALFYVRGSYFIIVVVGGGGGGGGDGGGGGSSSSSSSSSSNVSYAALNLSIIHVCVSK